MSVQTEYDDKRDELRDKLTECLKLAKDMLDEDIPGYSTMTSGYPMYVYQTIKTARDLV